MRVERKQCPEQSYGEGRHKQVQGYLDDITAIVVPAGNALQGTKRCKSSQHYKKMHVERCDDLNRITAARHVGRHILQAVIEYDAKHGKHLCIVEPDNALFAALLLVCC